MIFIQMYLAILAAVFTFKLYENYEEEQRRKKYNKNVNKR